MALHCLSLPAWVFYLFKLPYSDGVVFLLLHNTSLKTIGQHPFVVMAAAFI
jgi:hypothetical protein